MQILVADDDAVSRRLLEGYLRKWEFDVLSAADGAEAWRVLRSKDTPRLALLDWMMPGLDGIEICRQVRQRSSQPYVYVILLTGRSEKQDVIEGLEAGADDYLTKPFHAQELRARLRVGTRILDLQDTLVSMNETLQFKATHDPLTSLWNRGAILDILQREILRGQREGAPVGVLLGDLDHFKLINDTYGHLAGDDVLREAARRLGASVRAYDAVGRYGGEEFLIVLPGCNPRIASERADQICSVIRSNPIKGSERLLSVTLSVGAVSTDDRRDLDGDALLRAADWALYRAKEQGRDRAVLAGSEDILESQHKPAREPVPIEAQQRSR